MTSSKEKMPQEQSRMSLMPMFILHRLQEEPSSGYSLISYINSITQGSWKPGSGSIYPTLQRLERLGLIKKTGRGPRSKRIYSITEMGKRELNRLKAEFDRYSTERWHRIRGMMLFVVNPRSLAKMLNETIEMQREAWERVLSSNELSDREKNFFLEEHRLLVEDHLEWIKSKMKTYKGE